MNVKTTLIGALAFVLLAVSSFGAAAQTDEQIALNSGAQKLTADEIAERFVGKTGFWVSPSADMKLAIHYGEDNVLTGKLLGKDWTGTGYFGVANTDSICVSWDHKDEGRLRCLDVLMVDGVVKKFNSDGSLNGSYEKFEDGKTF